MRIDVERTLVLFRLSPISSFLFLVLLPLFPGPQSSTRHHIGRICLMPVDTFKTTMQVKGGDGVQVQHSPRPLLSFLHFSQILSLDHRLLIVPFYRCCFIFGSGCSCTVVNNCSSIAHRDSREKNSKSLIMSSCRCSRKRSRLRASGAFTKAAWLQ
jgi:hypothetical protein